MGRKFLISVCDINKRRFGVDNVTAEFTNGTKVSGKLIAVHADAWDSDYGLEIEGLPLLRVSYGFVVEIEEQVRPGDSREKPIIINNDSFKEEYIGMWVRWDDRPVSDTAILRSRSVIVETAGDDYLKETTTYSFVGIDAEPRRFIRRRKAT